MKEEEVHLIRDYLDGRILQEDLKTLESLLLESKSCREQFYRLATLDEGLHEIASHSTNGLSLVADVPESVIRPQFGNQVLKMAACLVVGGALGIAAIQLSKPEHSPVELARVTRSNLDQDAYAAHQLLAEGVLEFKDKSELQFELLNGVLVDLEGPAKLELFSLDKIGLHYGQLSVTVPENATGFTVETNQGDVVDLGTRFGVSVDQTGTLEAHVFEGEVDVEPKWNQQTVRLQEQEALVVSGRETKRAEAVPEQFPRQSVVSSNLVVEGGFEMEPQDWNPRRLEFPKEVGFWAGDEARVVDGGEFGIKPFEGSSMLQFVHGHHSLEAFSLFAERDLSSSDQWQIIDIRDLKREGASLRVTAEAWFNRVHEGKETDNRFGLRVTAFNWPFEDAYKRRHSQSALANISRDLYADNDPETWERLELDFEVPSQANYLLMLVVARENKLNDDPEEVEFHGHFVDGIRLQLTQDWEADFD